MPFLAPLLLIGAVFASAPIIIHLLNRRQFKLVEWAPMEYLKLTLRTNRRRLQLEQWVLLAIRTLVILLLIFAVARPFLSGDAAASWLSIGGRTSRVILIDDSLSMGLENNGESAFDRATEQAAGLIEALGTQDALTVVTTSSIDQPIQRDSTLGPDEAAALANQVRALEPTESANNWAATLSSLADLLDGTAHSSKEVRIFTDQRASGWSADAAEQAAKLEKMGVKVVIVKVGQGSPGNATLAELTQTTGVALVNTPIELVATIDTDGDPQFKADFATMMVDGEKNTVKLPAITAGQKGVPLKLNLTFDTPGTHTVELTLPDDAMPGDNTRSLTIEVAESVRILLVDGEPGIEARDSEVFYLAQVLFSGNTPIKTTVLPDSEWFNQPGVGNYDLVVLANVESVPAQRVEQLKALVESGMGLIVFPGDQVNPTPYNRLMYADGEGLLPAKIELGVDAEAEGLIIEQVDDTPMPILANIQVEKPALLAQATPWKINKVVLPELEGRTDTRVLARWNAPGLPPAAIEKRLGKGRVILWTVTADRAWSDWPTQGSYFVGVRESALNIAGVPSATGNLTAGQPIRQRVSASNPPSRADVVKPGDDKSHPAEIDRGDETAPQIVYADTHRAGLYELAWDVPGRDDDRQQVFAVSPDVRESELRQLSEEEIGQLLPGVDLTLIDASDPQTGGTQREIWRTLAMLLLGFVVVESAFAAWVGREH
ncbi:MAG: BatA domain-containing protein [Phycisphaeraceae bacterium]